jgi:hypothetical protein
VYPTLAGVAGYSAEIPAILQGKSLEPQLQGSTDASVEGYAYTITNGGSSLRTSRWRYTRWGSSTDGGNEELYDHATDPEEWNNLVGQASHTAVLDSLRNALDEVQGNVRR